MQRNKFLIWLLAIIITINIVYYIILPLFDIQGFIGKSVTKYLKENYSIDLKYDNLTINGSQINLTNISLLLDKNNIKIDEILVNYSLKKIIFRKPSPFSIIRIYNMQVDYSAEKNKRSDKKFDLPDLKKYFDELHIINGKVNFSYQSSSLSLAENISEINIDIINNINTKIDAKGNINDAKFDFQGIISNKELRYLLDIDNYSLQNLKVDALKNLTGIVNIELYNDDGIDNLEINGKNIQLNYKKYKLIFNDISGEGNKSSFSATSNNSILDDNKCSIEVHLKDVFTANYYSLQIDSPTFNIGKYTPHVEGKTKAIFSIDGDFHKYQVSAILNSDSLKIMDKQLSNIVGTASYIDKKLSFDFSKFDFENNEMQASGSYDVPSKIFEVTCLDDNFQYFKDDYQISGNMFLNYQYSNKLNKVNTLLSNAIIKSSSIVLDDINLDANLTGHDYQITVKSKKNNLNLHAAGNYKKQMADVTLNSTRLPLSSIFVKLSSPNIFASTDIDFSYSADSINTNGAVRIYDTKYGKLDGNYNIDIASDLKKNLTQFSLFTNSGIFNYEPFEIQVSGIIDSTSLYTNYLSINDNIDGNIQLFLDSDHRIISNLNGSDINFVDYLSYFYNRTETGYIDGKFDFNIDYDSEKDGNFEGYFNSKNFNFASTKNLNLELNIAGNNDKIKLKDSKLVTSKTNDEISLSGYYDFQKSNFLGIANVENIQLSDILKKDIGIKGFIKNSQLFFQSDKENKSMNFRCDIENVDLKGISIDTLSCNFIQKNEEFVLNKFYFKNDDLRFYSNGNLGYNFFELQSFENSEKIKYFLKGDVFSLLKPVLPIIDEAKSTCLFTGEVRIIDDKISIGNSKFNLSKSSLSFLDKRNNLSDINIDFQVVDDSLSIKRCSFSTGQGVFTAKNKITNTESDLKIGMINLGEILMRTDSKGIMLYLANYQSQKSMTDIRISGRDSNCFKIIGPIDNPTFIGDIEVANGNFVYPPDSDNLFKWINNEDKKTQVKNDSNLNLNFDVNILFGENTRYQTYPLDILIKEKSYLKLTYFDGKWEVPDAYFTSESGDLELFGTNFSVDNIELELSTSQNKMNLLGSFEKKSSDGSLITLEITPRESENNDKLFGGLEFGLNSDNPDDTNFESIMVKARYNKKLEDLSGAEQSGILEDELLNLAEIGIGNTIINPLISPLEVKLRRYLKLEYFSIKSGLIKNVYNRYISNEDEPDEATDIQPESGSSAQDLLEFGTSIFLNNLTLQTGKSLTDNLFIDYKIKFEKGTNIETNDLIYYQDISFRYNLPKKYKINLTYNIDPFIKNNYSIMLERSFKF